MESKNVIQMSLFTKTEIDLQTQITKNIKEENRGEVGEDKSGVRYQKMSPTIYKINNKDPLHSTGNLLS